MNTVNKVRRVFVTGAAKGIGKAISKEMLQRGAKVCVADINSNVGLQTVNKLKSETNNNDVMFVDCDVTNEDQFKDAIQRAVDTFGGLDLFVNNAGIIDEKNWKKCVEINQNGVIRGTNFAVEHMRTDKGGSGGNIINISSVAAFTPVHAMPTYCATKSAVRAYTSSLAEGQKLINTGIIFGCLCPAFADTDIIYPNASQVLDLPFLTDVVKQHGIMKVQTVVEAFCKLIDDNINGAVLTVTKAKGMVYKNKYNKL